MNTIRKSLMLTDNTLKTLTLGRHASLFIHHVYDQIVLLYMIGLFKDKINVDSFKKKSTGGWWAR